MADYSILARSLEGGGNAFNAFLQGGQQRMQEQAFAAEQERLARAEAEQQRTNQLLAGLLGPQTADMVTMSTPVGQIQAPAAQVNAERFNQLAQLDPRAAIQFQQIQQERAKADRAREVEEAKRLFTTSQYVARSASPKQLLLTGFPEYVEQLRSDGVDIDALSDDDVRRYAEIGMAHYGPIAGIGPPDGGEGFTLTPGGVRFDNQGRKIASVDALPTDKDPTDKAFSRANTLRDEFTTKSQPFREMQASYATLQAVLNDGTAAGDLAAVAAFMRAVDPGSRVTGSEQAAAENAGGVPAVIRSYYNKLLGEGSLSPQMRDDFLKQAANLVKARRPAYDSLRKEYTKRATKFEVDPFDVVGDEEEAPAAPPADDLSALSDDEIIKRLTGG